MREFLKGVLVAVCAVSLVLIGCKSSTDDSGNKLAGKDKTVSVTGVSLNKSTLSLEEGKTETLTATVAPSNATNKAVSWMSSNLNVATVENGTVTAIKAGTAVITVTTEDGKKTANCTVTVTLPVTGVALNKNAVTLEVGSFEVLSAFVTPVNANNAVNWSSSNTGVATVTNGTVIAKTEGKTTITVTTVDGGYTASCAVTVIAAPSDIIHVTDVTLSLSSATIDVGEYTQLTATVSPTNATNKRVSWNSSNTSVAMVTDGLVYGVSAGTATITVTTADIGETATCTVTVKAPVTTIPVTDVSLNKSAVSLTEGNTETLIATVTPAEATNKQVHWSSANATVASVNAAGMVTAIKAGIATITVYTADGNYTADCTVTVTAAPPATVSVSGVTLNKNTASLVVLDTEKLIATVLPGDATNKEVNWSSSNATVANVGTDGTVTAVGAGTAIITVQTLNGGYTDTCTITVSPAAVPVSKVSLDPSTLTLVVGGTSALGYTIEPANATNQDVTWDTSDSLVATVTNGFVTAVGAGEATITVTADNGEKATCVVTVVIPVVSVELDKTSLALIVGDTEELGATVNPDNATNKNVTWSSSAPSVATVSNGIVTAVGGGTAIITVTTADGNKTATCTVTVTVPVAGVSLNKPSTTIEAGKTEKLTATVNPANATNKNVSWDSSNTGVASVGTDGTVTAVSNGTATITATTADGGYTATCTVTVIVPVASVSLDKATLALAVNATEKLTATVNPDNATNKNVTWSSSVPSVATVTNGLVTAVSAGTATITVTTADGNKTASCMVTVTVPVTGVELNKYALLLKVNAGNANETETLIATVLPTNATNKGVTWSSSDNTVAMVATNGLVTAMGAGEASITVTTADGNKTASCTVTVILEGDPEPDPEPGYISFLWLGEIHMTAETVGDTTLSKEENESLTIRSAAGFTPVRWSVNGVQAQLGGTEFTFTSVNRNPGRYTVTLLASKDNKFYSVNVIVIVKADSSGSVGINYYWNEIDIKYETTGSTTLLKEKAEELEITLDGSFTPVLWSVNGRAEQTGGASFTFNSANRNVGRYTVTLLALKDSKYYNVNVIVTVTE